MLNTYIYHLLPSTCFGVCYTIFRETIALFAQESLLLAMLLTAPKHLTFRGPCIVIYSYNKTNEMHYFSNLFDKVLYMFRTCPMFIIRSISTLYTRNSYLSY